jgi:hypothetical protein
MGRSGKVLHDMRVKSSCLIRHHTVRIFKFFRAGTQRFWEHRRRWLRVKRAFAITICRKMVCNAPTKS